MFKVSRFFKFKCFVTAMFLMLMAKAQPVQINIMVNPLPSPYFSDWEVEDNIAVVQFNGNFPQPINIVIEAEVKEQNGTQLLLAQSEMLMLDQGPWNLLLNNPTIFDWPLLQLNPVLESQVSTGLIPDGNYTLCVRVLEANSSNLLGNACVPFSVLLPEPPIIIQPVQGQAVVAYNLIIQWFPVQWVPSHPVTYNLRIAEIYPNQVPQEAIENNPPHLEATVTDATLYVYPFEGLPLETGRQYAIMVQSVDEMGNPIGSNNGFSQVEFFQAGSSARPVFEYPWQADVYEYTNDEYLENVRLNGNPCEDIRKLIKKLQTRLTYVLFKQGEAQDKSDQSQQKIDQANKDLSDANKDLDQAKKDLDQATQDRQTILNAIVKNTGGQWGEWNNGKPNCNAAVVVGPNNGDLQLGSNKAICMGAGQVDKFVEQVNKWRDDLKALNKKIKNAEKAKEKAEKAKEKAEKEKEKAEKDKEKADKEAEEWKKEADALKEALNKLKKQADECDIIIEDLQKKYDEAKSKIDEAEDNLANASGNGGKNSNGENSDNELDNAQNKIDEAKKNLQDGNYPAAGEAAKEANEHTKKGKAWADAEDCLKRAKRRLKNAKKKVADQKAKYPGGDFTEADAAIAQAENDLAKAEEAYKNGDLETVKKLCPKILSGANSGAKAAGQITCNEGDTKEIKNKLVDEKKVGTIIMPYGVDPDNLGYKLKEFFDAIGDPLDISSYVDMIYSLTSVSYAKTVYGVYYKKQCTEVLICRNGKWVHKEYKNCEETLEQKVEIELLIGEIDIKERLESDLKNIYKELKNYLPKK